MLSQTDKKQLLKLVRASIEEELYNKEFKNLDLYSHYNELKGAFVTLYLNGELRGCIGHIISDEPLYKTLYTVAKEAAFDDDRFNELSKEEYQHLTVEISLLSEPIVVQHLNDIKLGTHGLILQYKDKSAVFLPHVAVEQGWDLQRYLIELGAKAKLKENEFEEARLFKFSTESISES